MLLSMMKDPSYLNGDRDQDPVAGTDMDSIRIKTLTVITKMSTTEKIKARFIGTRVSSRYSGSRTKIISGRPNFVSNIFMLFVSPDVQDFYEACGS